MLYEAWDTRQLFEYEGRVGESGHTDQSLQESPEGVRLKAKNQIVYRCQALYFCVRT